MPDSVRRILSDASESYANSENPFISTVRSVTSTVGGWFDETETAAVIRSFKEMDPSFELESFLKDVREYVVPEVVDAYVSGDLPTLRQWLDEGVSL